MLRPLSNRSLAIDLLTFINESKLYTWPDDISSYDISKLGKVNESIIYGACGRGKPTTPTIQYLISVYDKLQPDTKAKYKQILCKFFEIGKSESKRIHPLIEEFIK